MTENLNFWQTILHYVRTLDHDGCAFRRVTGLYCPGCGGTRALAELSHGHLIGSFLCHPLVIYLPLALLILCLATLLRQLMKKQRKRTIGQLLTVLLMLALMLLLAHCLIENMLLFLGFDLISIFQTDDFLGRRNMSKFVCHFMPPDHFRIRAIYYNTFCY